MAIMFYFLTGTDEHGSENTKSCRKKEYGTISSFVTKSAKLLNNLSKILNLSNTDFIRTTEDRHIKVSSISMEFIRKKW